MSHTIFSPSHDEGAGELHPAHAGISDLKLHLLTTAKRLATPWQVAFERSMRLAKMPLPDGVLLDPACGSGIQLAAHMLTLKRSGIGVELEPEVGRAAAANLWRVATYEKSENPSWLENSRVLIGDGCQSAEVCSHIAIEQVALLHLDPARPQNSRTHGIEEMSPQLGEVFTAWKSHLRQTDRGPAMLLDLSPRLLGEQRAQVESIVEEHWPSIGKTWEWTSRGGGRIDRLSLWLGAASTPGIGMRYVRIPPRWDEAAIIVESSQNEENWSAENQHSISPRSPRRGEYLTIVDSALVSSGLAAEWLKQNLDARDRQNWLAVEGRRPMIYHSQPLSSVALESRLLFQTSGQIVALCQSPLDMENIEEYVEICYDNNLTHITVRAPLDDAVQPQLQSAFHRMLAGGGSGGSGFIVSDPLSGGLIICRE